MIEVICPRCNRTLLVYGDNVAWDGGFLMKSLCCDEVFYLDNEIEEEYLERVFKREY